MQFTGLNVICGSLAENSQRAYKMCKGVKTVPGIPPLHAEICCKETAVPTSIPNCNGQHGSYVFGSFR